MKKRGRLYGKERIVVVEDRKYREETKHGKFYEFWGEEEILKSKERIISDLIKDYGLTPGKAGLAISWSIRDGITIEETIQKYRTKLFFKNRK